jgi:hypothetical protein
MSLWSRKRTEKKEKEKKKCYPEECGPEKGKCNFFTVVRLEVIYVFIWKKRQFIKHAYVASKFILSVTVGTCAIYGIATQHVTKCLCGSVHHQWPLNQTDNFHEAYQYCLLHYHTLSHFLYATNKLGAAVILMARATPTSCNVRCWKPIQLWT